MKKDIITFMNNNGEITNARIIYAYEKTGGKLGIVYTDDTKTKEGKVKTYATVFNPKNNKHKFQINHFYITSILYIK